ncbi:Histone-lysine N-methyltransferase ehmt2 [Balamuthia mandrillaris]
MLLPRMAAGACDLPNQSGVTPLMVACNRGHKDVVMCLFEGGANLDTVTGAGNSALHVGCSGGHPDVISALLHAGAKPFRNNFGQTPVDVASVCGHERTFRHTFEKSPELKEESGSLSYHQRELIKECGANTPYLSRVYKLLRKASPNVRASWGATPLSIAVRKGSLPVVKALLQSHADVFAMDADGKTALVQAIDYHHTDIALLLLEHGSDVKAPYYKESPLIRATYNGCFELLNPLLECGADPNGYNAHGWTPLAFAMNRGFIGSFKTLLAGGADPLFKYKSDYKSAWETAHSNPPKYQPFIALMEPYCSKPE